MKRWIRTNRLFDSFGFAAFVVEPVSLNDEYSLVYVFEAKKIEEITILLMTNKIREAIAMLEEA